MGGREEQAKIWELASHSKSCPTWTHFKLRRCFSSFKKLCLSLHYIGTLMVSMTTVMFHSNFYLYSIQRLWTDKYNDSFMYSFLCQVLVICGINLGLNYKKMCFEVSFEQNLSCSEQAVLTVETVRHETCCSVSKAGVVASWDTCTGMKG